ncbi:S8 family serine peptidase [Kitasatospora kazusensis]
MTTGQTSRGTGLPAWSVSVQGPPRIDLGSPPDHRATADWAWGGSTGAGVRVFVLDSGIEAAHPLVGGVDRSVAALPTGDGRHEIVDEEPVDLSGHGTACASIVRRIAPGASITSVRVLLHGLRGSGDALLTGLRWAVEQGADVINLSLSTAKPECDLALREIADRAYFAGCVIVASAHNRPVVSFPWSFASVLSVGSHGDPDADAFYTSATPPVEFFGPGSRVTAAWRDGRSITATGNSFATPHLAARCALVLGKHPQLTPYQLKAVLRQTAANAYWSPPGGPPEGTA